MRPERRPNRPWLDPNQAGPDGLVGVGGDLNPATLVHAYTDGVFPWFSPGDPVLWWSPDPRAIIEPARLHISRSLARTLRSGKFRVTVNECFGTVIRACAVRPGEGTWLTPQMISAYENLHRLGHAHSLETWVRSDDGSDGWQLAGGIYGVAVGGLFAGESMFYRISNGSKVALVALCERLANRGYTLFDVQMRTDHTARMGAIEVPRGEYLRRLRDAVVKTGVSFS